MPGFCAINPITNKNIVITSKGRVGPSSGTSLVINIRKKLRINPKKIGRWGTVVYPKLSHIIP